MSPMMIPVPLGMLLGLFLWLMVVLFMDKYMMRMGIISLDFYVNYFGQFFMRLANPYSLY